MIRRILLWGALLLIVIGVSSVAAIVTFDSEPDDAKPVQQQPPANQPPLDVTAGMLQAGIRAKQAEFEAQEPEYPDEDKIIYEISSDGSASPELHPADAQLWDLIKTLSPTEAIFNSIAQFEVYFDEADDTLASVESLDDTNSTWLYSVNYVAVTDFEELVPTIVHEFAHILGLQNGQTTTEAETPNISATCPNFLVIEGCLNDNSFLGDFFDEFWKDNEAFIGDQDRTEAQAASFFESRQNDFVSEYATTNAVEDFAESFMFYVMKDIPADQSTKAKKIRFFDSFAELQKYRLESRQAASGWANLSATILGPISRHSSTLIPIPSAFNVSTSR